MRVNEIQTSANGAWTYAGVWSPRGTMTARVCTTCGRKSLAKWFNRVVMDTIPCPTCKDAK